MRRTKRAYRCKKCLAIYKEKLPTICEKCGTTIGERDFKFPIFPGMKVSFSSFDDITTVIPTDECEIVKLKRRFFRWECDNQ